MKRLAVHDSSLWPCFVGVEPAVRSRMQGVDVREAGGPVAGWARPAFRDFGVYAPRSG